MNNLTGSEKNIIIGSNVETNCHHQVIGTKLQVIIELDLAGAVDVTKELMKLNNIPLENLDVDCFVNHLANEFYERVMNTWFV